MALLPARAAWLLGVVAAGCAFPHLSTSPDWQGDDGAVGGEPGQAGTSGSDSGGTGGRGGTMSVGGEGATAPIGGGGGEPPVVDDDIRGVVVDQYDTPIAGVVVLIDDVELVSDKNGEVSLVDSGKETFDVTIVDEASKVAYVYEGVTRRELRLSISARMNQTLHTATVSGATDIAFSEVNLRVAYDDRRRNYSALGVCNTADVAPSVRFDLTASWSGDEELDGNLAAMNFVGSPIQNMPESYEFGTMPLPLSAGDAQQNVSLKLTKLATRELHVAVATPPGFTRFDSLIFGNFAFSNASPTADETYVIPDDPAFDAADLPGYFALSCSSPEGNVTLLVPLEDTVEVEDECGTPPRAISPAAGATDVPKGTPFEFEPQLDGCHSFSISYQGSWSTLIFTMKSKTVAPDLSKYGLSDAPHDVSWTAGTTSPCTGIDGYLVPVDRDAPPARLTYTTRADRTANATFSTAN